MKQTTTLTKLWRLFGKTLPLLVFLAFSAMTVKAQFVNGNLGTGTVSKSGVTAPAGSQWHEMQGANNTEANSSIAFDCSPILGSSRVADNFTVPAGQQWSINRMTFYAVVLAPPPATSPITAVRVVIRDASPVGASNVIYGDLTTNRLAATSFSNIYTIQSSVVPPPTTPHQNFPVWRVEANVSVTLAPGTYWVEWQILGGAGQRVFALMSQPLNARTLPGYNGVNTFNSGPWQPTLDAGQPASLPDVNIDYCFGADYTVLPCNSPTASVLSQVGYPSPPVTVFNETFNTVAPLPAGWASQNLSTPAGLTGWFQGNVAVFPGNTPPGYIGANFNNVAGNNIISNWLFTPPVTLRNGDTLSFFTRSIGSIFPDRLQVRMNTTNQGVNAGATNTSVGDYTTLLLDINPTYTTTGYPSAWTQYKLPITGLAGPTPGRLAFRYFVEGGGPAGANSDYIGIDDVSYMTPGADVPPTTCVGSTANLKVDITGGNSPYTVVINATPATTGYPRTITNYISGSNIPITPVVTTTYNLVSVTGCGVGTGNSGTPTVTVSPASAPPIFITDNPTGPLCAGNPKLLTVSSPPPAASFTSGPLTINASGPASPYPLPLVVSGLPAGATVASVVLTNLNHTWTGDIDVAITGPTFVGGGSTQAVMLLSDLGNGGNFDAVNTTLTFTDGAAGLVPAVNPIPSGTYRPTNSGAVNDIMPAPGPNLNVANPVLTALNTATMNGTWNLWINDQVGGDGGNLASYTINFTFPAGPSIPPGTTFSWSPAAGLSSTTGNPVAASPMTTTTYTVLATFPGGCQTTASIPITVNQLPAVTSNPVNRTACVGSTVTFTVGATGTNITYQWQESTNGGASYTNISNGGIYGGATTATLTLTGVTATMNNYRYRCAISGTCPPTANSTGAILTVNGLPVIQITPPGPVCGGIAGVNGTLIVAGSSAPPIPGSVTFNSGPLNIAIPEGAFPNPPATAASNVIAVSGIPANATITNIHVKSNITHPWVADVVMVVKSPNGQVFNLDALLNYTNNPGANFLNTTISSAGTATLSSTAAPHTGIHRADAAGATFLFAGFTLAGGPVGFTPTTTNWNALYPAPVNGNWTIAAYDAGAPDVGTLTNWEITIDYTTPGGTGNPLTYTWAPAAGLYTNATATTPYIAGSQNNQVYAAPTVNTVYTITGTDGTTGCQNTGTIQVVYTPPAPIVNPANVAMCLGQNAVQLCITSSLAPSPFTATYSSGPITVPFPGPPAPNPQAGASHTIAVPLPSTAQITRAEVAVNFSHTWAGDVVVVLRAPNNQILNLDYFLSNTGGTGATTGFTNTRFASNSTTAISTGSNPYNGVFKADAQVAATGNGPAGPTGMLPTTALWSALYPSPGGNWTLGLYDNFAGDDGTLTSWSITFDYLYGAPASGVWSPATGLFRDAAATIPYVAGDTANCVYARPTPNGVYPYTVTVQSLGFDVFSSFNNPAPITIPSVGTGTPYPSNITVSGLPATNAAVDNVIIRGINHTWGDDIDILLQSPTGQNVVLMSDVGGTVAVPNATYTFRDGAPAMAFGAANPTGTYSPTNNGATDTWVAPGPGTITQAAPALALFGSTANVNGVWKLFVVDDVGGDQGSINGGWDITFRYPGPGCVSPARNVTVTVNQPTSITSQPVNRTVCTNNVATFSVTAAGTGPFSYQWQVSTNSGNTYTNVANGGVYSGATSATLTISGPPVSMSGYFYRCIITGAAPCASVTSFQAMLTVNPLPTIVISASPYTRLFPGLVTTLSSTVSPAAASTYTWLRNGVAIPGSTGTINVNVDGLGDYSLRVTDINGCTNTSNTISILDSASGKCFLYPNPTDGMFQVRYYSVANNVLPRTVTVYNSNGDRVLTQRFSIGAPYARMDIDLRRNGKGLYWVEVGDVNGNRLTMCRVVVQ